VKEMSEEKNELVKSEHYSNQQLMEDAKSWIESGLLPQNITKPEQVAVIVLKGRELGLKPMQSFEFIDIIMGKSALKPKGMLSLIRRGGVKYRTTKDFEAIKDEQGQVIDYVTEVQFIRDGMEDLVSYKWSDAVAMGLTNKSNWKQQPAIMLYWRAVSKGAARVCPDLINGMYTTEEVASFTPNAPMVTITEEGEAIVVG
jgi:hypothetical protein